MGHGMTCASAENQLAHYWRALAQIHTKNRSAPVRQCGPHKWGGHHWRKLAPPTCFARTGANSIKIIGG